MSTQIRIRIHEKSLKNIWKNGAGYEFGSKTLFHQVIIREGLPFQIVTENSFFEEEEESSMLKALL